MRRLTAAGVALLTGLAPAAPRLKDPPLAGEWLLVEVNGQPAHGFETVETFTPDGTIRAHTRMADGRVIDARTRYKVDRAARPARIDLTDGPTGQPAEGIFRVEGDTLKICVRHGPGSRPAEFKPGGDGEPSVLVYKRVKPKD
jgi:uncharacterized protein (TIGR03067 family)